MSKIASQSNKFHSIHTKKDNEKAHKRLTVTELKNCKGFENYSDEQAEETINSLEKLSILLYELYRKEKQKEKNP